MIHLRSLGTPYLEKNVGSATRPVAVQPKRLALLAYLALAGTRRYRRRDSIVALFWPELDDEHARGALRQALSYLRRRLGQNVVLTLGEEEVAIDPDVLRCDAVGFEEAIAAGRYEAAVAMYRGDFLDGLFVSDASNQLEQWVEGERARLRQRAAQACSSLAEERRAAGDATAAAECARRAAALVPFDEPELRRLMVLLDGIGDRAGAVEAYDQFARRLGSEYATEPSAETQATIGAIRRRIEIAANATSRMRAPPLSATDFKIDVAELEPQQEPVSARTSEMPQSASAPPARVERESEADNVTKIAERPRRRFFQIASVAGTGLVCTLLYGSSGVIRPRSVDPHVIVALPFRVTSSDPQLNIVREGVLDLFAARITADETSGYRMASVRNIFASLRDIGTSERNALDDNEALEFARELGGGRLLTGSAVGTVHHFALAATLIDVASKRSLASATVEGPLDSLTHLVDRLSAAILSLEAGEPLHRLDALTSSSFIAVRHYLEAKTKLRRGEYAEASRHFRAAIDVDSTFASAGLALADAANMAMSPAEFEFADYGLRVAWRYREKLSPQDRRFLIAISGASYPAARDMAAEYAALEQAVREMPDRAEAWYRLGDIVFHAGPMIGLEASDVRAMQMLGRALELDSTLYVAEQHLFWIAELRRDTAAARSYGTQFLQKKHLGRESAAELRIDLAALLQDSATLDSIGADLASLPHDVLERLALGRTFVADWPGMRDPWARRARDILLSRAITDEQRVEAHTVAALMALNDGATAEAQRSVDAITALTRRANRWLSFMIRAGLYWDGDLAAAEAAAQVAVRALSQTPSDPGTIAEQYDLMCALEQWKIAHHQFETAERSIRRLMEKPPVELTDAQRSRNAICARLLTAAFAVERGDRNAGTYVTALDSLLRRGPPAFSTVMMANLAVAGLLERSGKPGAALRAVRRVGRGFGRPYYYSTYLRERGRLAERMGERDEAIAAYEKYLRVRNRPDQYTRAQNEWVRDRLMRLTR